MSAIADAEITTPSPSRSSSRRGRAARAVVRVLGRLALSLVFLLLWAWCIGAIWYSDLGPAFVRITLAIVFALPFPIAWYRSRRRRRFVAISFFVTVALIVLAWQRVVPSNDRDWSTDMQVLPHATFDGDLVHIANVRNFEYASTDEYTVRYDDRTYDLRELDAVHYMVEPFWGFRGSAHTLLTFGFGPDTFVAISVELRREKGEHFHPVPGFYRRYELAYIVGDERDVIRLRTNFREDKVYLYPIEASPEKLRELFVDMIGRANELRERPEFYNTFTSSCTTNIVDHINRIAPNRIPFSFKVLLPGYSDGLAYDLGLVSNELSFEETQKRYRIDERAREIGDDPRFSAKIRE